MGMDPKRYVLVMAGGAGERLWPLSRTGMPKQFVALDDGESLLEGAFRRAAGLVGPAHVFAVANARMRALITRALPKLPRENVIEEPAGRNTAACIALGAACILSRNPEAVLLVTPADHMVWDEPRFQAAAATAMQVAEAGGRLVALGLVPLRPEVGYGYIKLGRSMETEGDVGVFESEGFVEKPDEERARRFVEDGTHLWNSGMFAWRCDTFLDAVRAHLPQLYEVVRRVNDLSAERFTQAWHDLPSISVDYGILEKADDIVAVQGQFGWDDLGTWASLDRIKRPDRRGNIVTDWAVPLDTERSIVYNGSPGTVVATFGVRDVVVAQCGDAVLVADKSRAARLKELVAELRRQGYDRHIDDLPRSAHEHLGMEDFDPEVHVVQKPWGREVWWAHTDRYVGKMICVRAGCALSLQYHVKKKETLLFLSGTGELEVNEDVRSIRPGLTVTFEPHTIHRVRAGTDVVFFEVSTPDVDDVVRLDDLYGRAEVASARQA